MDDVTTELADYGADGFAVVRGLIDADAVAELSAALEGDRRSPSEHYGRINPAGEPGAVDSDLFAARRDQRVDGRCRSGPIPELAGTVLDADQVVLVEDQWFRAEPGARTGSPWHHDAPYYNIDGDFCVVWIALDDHAAGEGLSVTPGSHRNGRLFPPLHFGSGDDRPRAGGAPGPADLAGAVELATAAGDAVVFDSRTLHCGGPPRGAVRRRWSIRYAAPTATYVDRGRDAAAFWRLVDHGLAPGDPLACDAFPLVAATAQP